MSGKPGNWTRKPGGPASQKAPVSHQKPTTVTRALLVVQVESLGFLAHSITSRISRKVTGIAEEVIT